MSVVIHVPNCDLIMEPHAMLIMGWSQAELLNAKSYRGFPLPKQGYCELVISTEEIIQWARSPEYEVKKHGATL